MKDKIKYKIVWRCDRCKDIVAEGSEKPKSTMITIKSGMAWANTIAGRSYIEWKSKNVICVCARCRSHLQDILGPFGVDFNRGHFPTSEEKIVEDEE